MKVVHNSTANHAKLKLAGASIPRKGLVLTHGLTTATCNQFRPSKNVKTKARR
jgi:hypothetical protein